MNKWGIVLIAVLITQALHGAVAPSQPMRVAWSNVRTLASSITDTNLTISGVNTMASDVTINALTTNVTVTIDTAGATIRGSNTFTFNTQIGRTIHVVIQGDLTFASLEHIGEQSRLPIIIKGSGQVVFEIYPGKTLTLASEERTNGAHILVALQRIPAKFMIKKNNTTTSAAEAWVDIKEKSSMAFCTLTTTNLLLGSAASIIIDTTPSTNSPGGIVVTLANRGAFFIDNGLAFDGTKGTLEAVLPDTQAIASVNLINSSTTIQGSFVILNANNVVPNLKQDTRNQRIPYGFTLGRKAALFVGDNIAFIHGTLMANQPVFDSECGRLSVNPSAFFVRGFINHSPSYVSLGAQSSLLFFAGLRDACCVTNNKTLPLMLNKYCDVRDLMTRGHGAIVLDLQGDLLVNGKSPNQSVIAKMSQSVDQRNTTTFASGALPRLVGQNSVSTKNVPIFFNNSCFYHDMSKLSLYNCTLDHEDLGHDIPFEVAMKHLSEPAYVGIKDSDFNDNPKCELYNSCLALRSPACFAGVDLVVPQLSDGNVSAVVWSALWPAPYQPQLLFGASFTAKLPSERLRLVPANLNVWRDNNDIDTSSLVVAPVHKLIFNGTLNPSAHCDLFLQKGSGFIIGDDQVSWDSFTRTDLLGAQFSQWECIGSNLFAVYGDENPATMQSPAVPQVFLGLQTQLLIDSSAQMLIKPPVRYGGLASGTMPDRVITGTISFAGGFVMLEQN